LDGEGIRYELADFAKTVEKKRYSFYISESLSKAIAQIMEFFRKRRNMTEI